MKPNQKLYVLVRGDIPVGYQMAQSNHASFRFALEHPELTREWMEQSEYICILKTENLTQLEHYLAAAKESHITTSEFREPDLNHELTAIALAPTPAAGFLCRALKLAG